MTKATWANFAELKAQFGSADLVGGDRVVFNIAGHNFRLIVKFVFAHQVAFIRFIGTHKDYDKIKGHPLMTPIGHFTDQKEVCNMITGLGQSIPLEAQGWKNFNKDESA